MTTPPAAPNGGKPPPPPQAAPPKAAPPKAAPPKAAPPKAAPPKAVPSKTAPPKAAPSAPAAPAHPAPPSPAPSGKRTDHHDNWITTLGQHLSHDVSAMLASPRVQAIERGVHNLGAGAETALYDMKSGVTKVGGHLLHKDVGQSLAADDKKRASIAAGADTNSFAFKAGKVATHVVVDTAATVALAAGGEVVLGAAGAGAGVAGLATAAGLEGTAATVAGRLAVGAVANAVGSGVVTGAEGGGVKEVLKSSLVGGLSVGMGHVVGEAVAPMSRALAGRMAQAAPALAKASGRAVRVGSEAVSGAATGAGVSALTGDKPEDIARNALFGGALSGVFATGLARGAHEPASANPHGSPAAGTQPHPASMIMGGIKDALRPVGETVRLAGVKLKHVWGKYEDRIKPGALFAGVTPTIHNPVTNTNAGSVLSVFTRKPPGATSAPKPIVFVPTPLHTVSVPDHVPVIGGTTLSVGTTYSYNTGNKVEASGVNATLTKPITKVPGTDVGVSGGIWAGISQTGITPRSVVRAMRGKTDVPEPPLRVTISGGLIGSIGWPGIKATGGTMHTLHIGTDTEGKLNRIAINNTELALGPFKGLQIAWPTRVVLGAFKRLGRAKRRRPAAPGTSTGAAPGPAREQGSDGEGAPPGASPQDGPLDSPP